MIESVLKEYLTHAGDLPGHPAELFVEPQFVDTEITCTNRNDARRHLQNRLGVNSYFVSRRPANSGHSAVVMSRITTERDNHLRGEVPWPQAYIQFELYGKDPDAGYRNDVHAQLLRLALNSYRGYMGARNLIWIESVTILRDSDRVIKPADASDHWSHLRSFDAMVRHYEAVPDYPTNPLLAKLEATATGADVRLVDATMPLPGDPIADVQWIIRTSPTGSPVMDFHGPPDLPASQGAGLNRDVTVTISGPVETIYVNHVVKTTSGRTSTSDQLAIDL